MTDGRGHSIARRKCGAVPVEYTITRDRAGRFFIAIDGAWAVPDFGNPDDARAWCKAHAAATGQRNAGITEVFGRNAQLVQGPRGGWRRFSN
jgi:hypothetical protein